MFENFNGFKTIKNLPNNTIKNLIELLATKSTEELKQLNEQDKSYLQIFQHGKVVGYDMATDNLLKFIKHHFQDQFQFYLSDTPEETAFKSGINYLIFLLNCVFKLEVREL